MTGLANDTVPYRYGTADGEQEDSAPLGATQTVYYGSVALLSGSGAVTTGYLKNAATPGSSDTVIGMIGEPAGGTYVKTGPGIVGSSADGGVWVNVMRGTFYFQSATGGDALTESLVGKTVFYKGENTTGPIASATNDTNTLPTLGVLVAQDPGIANGFSPGSSWWPVRLNPTAGAS